MRMYSDIDAPRERLTVTFLQEINLYDISEMVHTSQSAGILHFQLLADVRNARFQMTQADLPRFRELLQELATRSRLGQTAVLVSDETDLAVTEIIRAQSAGLCDVKGFLDPQEARRWLGWTD
jgi:hypothetical protein